jgi:uncharacterized DUF497 family protein/DNA-binding XRE family transcriptional regulator
MADDIRYTSKGTTFVWRRTKADQVKQERGITIRDVADAYNDPNYLPEQDAVHPDRGRFIGISPSRGMLLVVHVLVDEEQDHMRIITAWPATRSEARRYLGASEKDPDRPRFRSTPFLRFLKRHHAPVRPRRKGPSRMAKNTLTRGRRLHRIGRLSTPAQRLLEARRAWGFTQSELARRSGVAQTVISNIEAGRIGLGPRRAEKLGKALGIAPGILIWGSGA